MKSYANSDSSSEVFSGGKFGGITLAFSAIASAAATALTEAAIDTFQISIGVTLQRVVNGKQVNHTILEKQALKPIIFASAIKTGLFGYWSPANTSNNGYTIRLSQAAGVNEIGEKYAYIPFGGVVDCTGENGGKIIVETNVRSLFGSTTNTSTSKVIVDLKEVEGMETYVPRINTEVVPTNQQTIGFAFSEPIRRLSIVNFDKTTLLTADMVLQGVNLQSEQMAYDYNDQQMIMFNVEQYSNLTDGENALQNFDLLPFAPSKTYTDVKGTISLQSADVAASQNFIVYWGAKSTIGSELQFNRALKLNQSLATTFQQSATA
jgi:hypothetical protein